MDTAPANSPLLPDLVADVLEALPLAVLVVDARQRICLVNREAERLFAYTRGELLGQGIELLVPEALRSEHRELVGHFLQAPVVHTMGIGRDLVARCADGRLVPVEVALKPIQAGDKALVIAAILDLTARKALEERVLADKEALERLVRQRTEELEQRNAEQREIVACLETTRAELERLAREDALTGLANRRGFDARLELEYQRAVRQQSPLSLAMVDLDRFKRVNDAFGHAIGDEVLRRVGTILRENCRAGDLPARYGGEEFAIALPDTNLLAAQSLCERIRLVVLGHDWASLRAGLEVSVSIGVAMRHESETAEALVSAADRCLYQAKHAGRNRVTIRSTG